MGELCVVGFVVVGWVFDVISVMSVVVFVVYFMELFGWVDVFVNNVVVIIMYDE